MALFDGSAASEVRRRVPILGYVGANGSGKSLLAVSDSVVSLRSGRRVLSTVRLTSDGACELEAEDCKVWGLHPAHKAPHPLWSPLTCWDDLLQAEHCDVLLDEVTTVASSRDASGLPPEVVDWLVQLRRRDVVLRWTAPSWSRADLVLREVSQGAAICKGLLRRRAEGQDWPTATWIASRLVDARDLDEMTQSVRQGVDKKINTIKRSWQLVSRTVGRDYYATLDSVVGLSREGRGGTCMTCGGRRAPLRCGCAGPHEVGKRAARSAA